MHRFVNRATRAAHRTMPKQHVSIRFARVTEINQNFDDLEAAIDKK